MNIEKGYIDVPLIVGLALYCIYTVVNRFFVEIPDILAYPWMIISCICMLVGLYRTGKNLGSRKRR